MTIISEDTLTLADLAKQNAALQALVTTLVDVRNLSPLTSAPEDVLAAFEAEQRAAGYAHATVRNRLVILDYMQRTVGVPLLEVTHDQYVAYIGRAGITNSTRRINQVAARAFYEFAAARRFRLDDPTDGVAFVRVPRGEPRPFSRDQIELLLMSGGYARTRAMILVGYYQGFRVSQIAAVHGRDVDTRGMTITTIGKGSKPRRLPLHPVIAALALRMPHDDWWFPARAGRDGHITPQSVTDLITRAKKRAGITDPRLTPHSLRHAFATHMVDAGVDVLIIKELMMHESLATTQVYAGVSESLKRRGIEALEGREIPAHSTRGRMKP